MTFKKLVPLVISSLLTAGCSSSEPGEVEVKYLVPEIVNTLPFNETSFTQGLEVDGSELIISTGQYGESRIYRSTIEGQELASQPLEAGFFGEGITKAGDIIWQLTWNEGVAFKRDATTLEELERINYEGEGWGLCTSGDQLIMSDGSSQLQVRDADTFEQLSTIDVTLEGKPVESLNELECVDGEVYANIFTETDIVRIDQETGVVNAVIDASSLPNNAVQDIDNVLNGIAFDPESENFYLAGKRWPDLYEVRFIPAG
ncbi:glutaminyl-peptide cyclotransferase [Corynebacterium callunae]|uniref:glutaminyl-peptide cyclotransferase n=1 Tax=Corynebacterium callunae TaxID=1721 RepID=UPI0039821773